MLETGINVAMTGSMDYDNKEATDENIQATGIFRNDKGLDFSGGN